MVILNFTCQEKKQALLDKSCSQTIRTDDKKFWVQLGPHTKAWRPLHIWWNARNFHVEDICECGHPRSKHNYKAHPYYSATSGITLEEGMCLQGFIKGGKMSFQNRDCKCSEFKLKRQGLGKSQFLGMGEITSIVRKKVSEITEEDAIADGFKTETHQFERFTVTNDANWLLIQWLLSKNKNLTLDSYVYVIRWRWIK